MTRARDIANFGDGIATADIDDGAVTAAKINSAVALGITEIDSWRINTNFSPTVDAVTPFTANFERDDTDLNGKLGTGMTESDDTDLNGKLGTGMTESSGVFTFPSTGYWEVNAYMTAYDNGGNVIEIFLYIDVSTDSGSNYDVAAVAGSSIASISGFPRSFTNTKKFFKVTNASTTRVRFKYYFSDQTPVIETGGGNQNTTYFTFVKMAEV